MISASPATILVVDDDSIVLEGVAACLEDLGHHVITASGGREGLETFSRETPDLVMLDLWMPGMGGLELLEKIQASKPDQPVIVVSGSGVLTDAVQALRRGAWDYIIKPIQDMTVLGHAVDRALERARLIEMNRMYRDHLEHQVAERTQSLTRAVEDLRKEIGTRLRAESDLEESERRLESIIRTIPDVIFRLSSEGIVTFLSDAARKYDVQPQDYIGRPFLDMVHPGDWEAARGLLTDPAPSGGRSIAVELRLFPQHRSSPVRHLESWLDPDLAADPPDPVFLVEAAPLRTPDDSRPSTFVGLQGIARDLTERRMLEEQLHHAQKMDAFGQLAGGVAHDFNNMLAVIQGYGQMALKRPGDADRVVECLQSMLKAGERAANLARRLLIFSRKQPLRPEVLDLNQVIDDMFKMLGRVLREDIELIWTRDPGLGQVRADKGHIEQIIMNLIVNARDALESGGRIWIETGNLDIALADCRHRPGLRPGSYVRITIRDNGRGMSESVRRRVFEPFFTTKPEGKGTGLGLAMVYGIVRRSDGFVDVTSEPGRGATFEILLPRVSETVQVSGEAGSDELAGGTETILLAEDDEGVRNMLKEFLGDLGFKVLAAADGGQALALDETLSVLHLLLTDMIMPDLRGHQLAALLRERRPGLKVVYMSGHTENEILEADHSIGPAAFIRKPFRFPELARLIRDRLDQPA